MSTAASSLRVQLADLPSLGFDAQLTPSKAALVLATYPAATDWHSSAEWQQISGYVAQACRVASRLLPMVPPPDASRPRRDTRPLAAAARAADAPWRVFTDMTAPRKAVRRSGVQWVDDQGDADVWITTQPIRDFISLPPSLRVSQFPYEGGFVRKDLLPLTVRRFCFSRAGDPASAPFWWLPCFDMATEFHLFAAEHSRRTTMGEDNVWIVKPAVGTRGAGHHIVRTVAEAAAVVRGDKSGDRVAQLLVTSPLCAVSRKEQLRLPRQLALPCKGRKLDLRIFVLVRSFAPTLEIFRHSHCYARLCNKAYDAAALTDDSVQITTAGVTDGQAGEPSDAAIEDDDGQARLLWPELAQRLAQERPGFSSDAVLASIDTMLGDFFGKAGPGAIGGPWPCSRAYYGCDVILDDGPFAATHVATDLPVPKLVEVNFMADWDVALLAGRQIQQHDLVGQWADDMVTALATDDDLAANPRFTRLVPS